jgi:MinD-like ATPase involved in chromosome partitioning or flagellar assembly
VSTGTEEVPVEPEPGAVDRLAVQRQASPLQRAHQAWEATDYKRRLEAFIEAPRLTRCVTIAVVSPKGGVGKTTTTMLLGTILATVRSDRVVAVDTDPDYGTLGRSFAPVNPMYVDDLAQLLDQPALTATMLDRFLSRAAHGLMVLPAPVDPDRMDTLDREDYARVIGGLKAMVGILVLDCGAGMRAPATRAALDAADQLVLVTDADPATASLVADVANRFHERPHVLVVNKSPRRGGRLNLDRLAEDVPSAGAVVEIDADSQAAEAVGLGQFNWTLAQDGWQLAARELAAHLAAGWEKLGATG